MKIHEISSERLTIDDIKRIMTEGYKPSLSKGSIERINACRDYLDNKMKTQKETSMNRHHTRNQISEIFLVLLIRHIIIKEINGLKRTQKEKIRR